MLVSKEVKGGGPPVVRKLENYPRILSHFLWQSDSDVIKKILRHETENEDSGLVLQVRSWRPREGSNYLKVAILSDDRGETWAPDFPDSPL